MNDRHAEMPKLIDPKTGRSEESRRLPKCVQDLAAFIRANSRLEPEGQGLRLTVSLPVRVKGRYMMLEVARDVADVRFAPYRRHYDYRKLQKALLTDELTGLYNRRFVNGRLYAAIRRSKRPMTLMLVDIDRFKAINDAFGHVAGDQVLREFSNLLAGQVRRGKDRVARYGGEEFLICLNDSGRETSVKTAERIRQAVMFHGFQCAQTVIRLTCSIGVHTLEKGDRYRTMEDLIKLVDYKLYQAKKAGRNRIVGT